MAPCHQQGSATGEGVSQESPRWLALRLLRTQRPHDSLQASSMGGAVFSWEHPETRSEISHGAAGCHLTRTELPQLRTRASSLPSDWAMLHATYWVSSEFDLYLPHQTAAPEGRGASRSHCRCLGLRILLSFNLFLFKILFLF